MMEGITGHEIPLHGSSIEAGNRPTSAGKPRHHPDVKSGADPFQPPDEVSITASVMEAAAAENPDREADDPRNDPDSLTNAEEQKLQELQAKDRRVKSREIASHIVAGSLAVGAPQFTYEIGPDGKRYAVEGEMEIRVSEAKTPEETIERAERARRAVQSSPNQSAKDKTVLTKATQLITKTSRELEEDSRGPEQNPARAIEAYDEAASDPTEEESADFLI